MSRETDRTEALRRELVGAIVQETGMREMIALPIANALVSYLQRQYAGSSIYIPAAGRRYDLPALEAALARGDSANTICAAHGISRRTLSRLFPGGLRKMKA